MAKLHPIILCGGGGTRLWPKSRKARPKPFIQLLGDRTLFQLGLDRVSDRDIFARPLIVAGQSHVGQIKQQVEDETSALVIVEPSPRNTAPAIALAAHFMSSDDLMLVCPSDQYIANKGAFLSGVQKAAHLAREGWLVAFGIAPSSPETGYGYIRLGQELEDGHRVERFVEKPDRATAERLVASENHVWNGGIFCFQAGSFLRELGRHRPVMAAQVGEAMEGAGMAGQLCRPAAAPFDSITGESIDYAVMENTARAAVVSVDMDWSDIGNWDALWMARECDEQGNSIVGRADLIDCRNVLVESDGPRVSVIGLEDIVIAIDGDEVLVTKRTSAQDVGNLPGAKNQ